MHPPPDTIRTPRLLLRRWRPEDLAPFAAMNADPEVMRFFPATQGRQESDAVAARLIGFFETDHVGAYAAEIPGESEFAGFVGVWPARGELPFGGALQVGWRLARPFWGRGFAPEAARATLDDAFRRLAPEEILAYTAAVNAPSRRVMEKLGMRHDPQADFEHPAVPEGSPIRPHVLYRLRREEWDRARDGSGEAGR